jgi:hypothetical protein
MTIRLRGLHQSFGVLLALRATCVGVLHERLQLFAVRKAWIEIFCFSDFTATLL